eukprot:972414-Lingulodinium_polyedra.AAC.1
MALGALFERERFMKGYLVVDKESCRVGRVCGAAAEAFKFGLCVEHLPVAKPLADGHMMVARR